MDSLVRPTPLAVRKYARNLQDTEERAWLCARLSVFGFRVGVALVVVVPLPLRELVALAAPGGAGRAAP